MTSQRKLSRQDLAKLYIQDMVKSAKESTWSSFILTRSQSVVISSFLSFIISFLWLISTFGYWTWSISPTFIIGITLFCASFSFSNVIQCYILPGEPLSCPPQFQYPICINWYGNDVLKATSNASNIFAMQVVTILGSINALVCSALSLYTWTTIADQRSFRRSMIAGIYFAIFNATLSLADFVLYIYFDYPNRLSSKEGCILRYNKNNEIICEPATDLAPFMGKSYAFTSTVVIFVFSLINAVSFGMGSLIQHYDIDKDD
jgi:hypothetical protein